MLNPLRALFAAASFVLISTPAFAADVTGFWLTDDGQGIVQIHRCGKGKARCGRIVWLKTPLDAKGRPLHDGNNPSPKQSKRRLCGTEVLSGVHRQDDGTWDGGNIYDPEEGKSYDVILRSRGRYKLDVRGYLGFEALGETRTWLRVPTRATGCRIGPGALRRK